MLRFDPFTDIDAITKSVLAAGTGNGRSPRFMPMDLYKVEDLYVLHADLPGVDPGSVDVRIDGSTLTLTAHRTALSEEGVSWLASERFAGNIQTAAVHQRRHRRPTDRGLVRQRRVDGDVADRREGETAADRGLLRTTLPNR